MPACTCLMQCSIMTCSCCRLTRNLSLCALLPHTRLPEERPEHRQLISSHMAQRIVRVDKHMCYKIEKGTHNAHAQPQHKQQVQRQVDRVLRDARNQRRPAEQSHSLSAASERS